MGSRVKPFSLAACLFVFLFVVVGASLHLKPLGAFLAALSGTSLVIHGVKRWGEVRQGAARKSETRITNLEERLMVPDRQDRAGDSERLASRVASQVTKSRDSR